MTSRPELLKEKIDKQYADAKCLDDEIVAFLDSIRDMTRLKMEEVFFENLVTAPSEDRFFRALEEAGTTIAAWLREYLENQGFSACLIDAVEATFIVEGKARINELILSTSEGGRA